MQDENATLNLQLNVKEEEVGKVRGENEGLVGRLVELKGRMDRRGDGSGGG